MFRKHWNWYGDVDGCLCLVCPLISALPVLQEIVDHFVILRPDVGAVKVSRCRPPGGGLGLGLGLSLPEVPLVTAGPRYCVVWRGVAGRTLRADLVDLVFVEAVIDVVVIGEYLLRHFIVKLVRYFALFTFSYRKIVPRWRSWNFWSDGDILPLIEWDKHGVDAPSVPGRHRLGRLAARTVFRLVSWLDGGGLRHVGRFSMVRSSSVRSLSLWWIGRGWFASLVGGLGIREDHRRSPGGRSLFLLCRVQTYIIRFLNRLNVLNKIFQKMNISTFTWIENLESSLFKKKSFVFWLLSKYCLTGLDFLVDWNEKGS